MAGAHTKKEKEVFVEKDIIKEVSQDELGNLVDTSVESEDETTKVENISDIQCHGLSVLGILCGMCRVYNNISSGMWHVQFRSVHYAGCLHGSILLRSFFLGSIM